MQSVPSDPPSSTCLSTTCIRDLSPPRSKQSRGWKRDRKRSAEHNLSLNSPLADNYVSPLHALFCCLDHVHTARCLPSSYIIMPSIHDRATVTTTKALLTPSLAASPGKGVSPITYLGEVQYLVS